MAWSLAFTIGCGADVLGYQRGFPEYCQEHGEVQDSTPEPMPRIPTGRLLQITPEQDHRKAV